MAKSERTGNISKSATKSTALTVWAAKLSELAAAATKTIASVGGAGNFLSIKSGVLSYQKIPIPENKMKVIVLAQILENQHYDVAFDPNAPASPSCYAFGEDRKTMIPHEAVEEPVNPTCLGCPNKEFGTADRGKGKACGDVIRLALITEGDMENIETAEIAYLKVPYFSTLEWAGYVRQLEEIHHKPPLAFVTEISVAPDTKSQFRVKFKMADEIEAVDETFQALWAKYEEAAKNIAFPYPKFEAAEAPVKPQPRRQAPAPRRAVAAPHVPPPQSASAAARAAAIPLPISTAGKVKIGAKKATKF